MDNSPHILGTSLKCFFREANEAEEQERSDLENGDSAVPHDRDTSELSAFLHSGYFLSQANGIFTNCCQMVKAL